MIADYKKLKSLINLVNQLVISRSNTRISILIYKGGARVWRPLFFEALSQNCFPLLSQNKIIIIFFGSTHVVTAMGKIANTPTVHTNCFVPHIFTPTSPTSFFLQEKLPLHACSSSVLHREKKMASLCVCVCVW